MHSLLKQKTIRLNCILKRTNSVFQTLSADEFPKLYEEKGEKLAILEGKHIKMNFHPSFSQQARIRRGPALSGILVRKEAQGFLLVATDGYRLSLRHYKVLMRP